MNQKFNQGGRVPGRTCPGCHKTIDAQTCVDEKKKRDPQEGDLSVCLYCCKILRYNADLSVRGLTQQEHIDLVSDADTWDIVRKQIETLKEMHAIIAEIKSHGALGKLMGVSINGGPMLPWNK